MSLRDDVVHGINLIWNNHFDEAELHFKRSKEISPRSALHYAETVFLKSFITADSGDTAASLTRLKDAKDLAERHIKNLEKGNDPCNPTTKITDQTLVLNQLLDSRIVVGESLYMTAILQMTRDAKLKGAFNLRKSWKIFERCLKETKYAREKQNVVINPQTMECLHFDVGFFLFAVSIIPSKFLKFVQLAGFKSDRDAGLFHLRESHKNDGVRGPFATMALLFNDLLLPRGLSDASVYLLEADELIKESLEEYPNGSLFQVMGSHLARKQYDLDKGIRLMEEALENCKHFNAPPLIYRYELANCYCMKLQWSQAAQLYLPLVDEQRFQVRMFCCLQLGNCYIMMGEKEKAMKIYRKALDLPGRKSNFDPMLVRQIKRYISNGANFAAFEILYLRRDLAKMTNLISELTKSLDEATSNTNARTPYTRKLPSKPTNHRFEFMKSIATSTLTTLKKTEVDYEADDRASYLLMKGAILKATNKLPDAIDHFKELLEMQEFISEKWYVPYCQYELGEAYFQQGKLKEAEATMKLCSKISGYDYEDPLKIRLRVTLDQLKKGDKAPEQEIRSIFDTVGSESISTYEETEEPDLDDEGGSITEEE